MNITWLSQDLWSWIEKQAGGKRVKDRTLLDGDSAPDWDYSPGVTHWKNGVPKSYDRCTSTVTVGVQWLAERFPVQCATARLANETHLVMSQQEIDACEKERSDRDHLARLAAEAVRRNAEAWARIEHRLANDRDFSPEERSLYAD